MKYKIKLLAQLIICTISLSACTQEPKTFKETQEKLMEGKTDQDLIEEIYSKPMNYKIVRITTPNGNLSGLGLSEGGVLQVMFYQGKIFIEKFGEFAGSYETKYFSNAEGSTKITFKGEDNLNDKVWNGGERINPQWISNAITITQYYPIESQYLAPSIRVSYVLRRM